MPFAWSLNPYTGCAHRCTFCYVRGFEQRADRPSDDRYGTDIRVKVNVAEVLRRELARRSWAREEVTIGAATDPYQPAEGRYRLTRACIVELSRARHAVLDHHPRAAGRGATSTCSQEASRPRRRHGQRLGADPRRPRLAHDGARDGAAAAPARDRPPPRRRRHPHERRVAPILPGLSDAPEQLAETVAAAREAGAHHIWANVLNLRPGTREHFLECLARDWPEERARYEELYGDRSYLPRETDRGRDAIGRRARPRAREQRGRPPLRPRPDPDAADPRLTAAVESPSCRKPPRSPSCSRTITRSCARACGWRSCARPHQRRRRGSRRRDGRRARRAAPSRRDHHGPPHAGHGRHRGDGGDHPRHARREGAHLHGLLGARAPPARPRVRRPRLHPQGGAARDAAAGDREGRRRRDVRRPGADVGADEVARRQRRAHGARARDPAAPRRRHVERRRRRSSSSSRRRRSRATCATSSRSSRPTRARRPSRSRCATR